MAQKTVSAGAGITGVLIFADKQKFTIVVNSFIILFIHVVLWKFCIA